ncbi:DUF3325 domain-containing protein (plasmid) [Cereibacter azotoformans]|uniref:DUF3325 domain-containing protein n=1 Tax=Cereibacter azotoformans TaxID=43057 RepID=UPI001EEA825E|nr:DUF3325 domain-containing protein [Cereibacter azotoformans]ULB12404.1 DUF3325 domain-containing protein [Cereibacter azotoformans]
MTAIWLNAAMLLLATGGFLALALASDKPGAALLGHKPATTQRRRGLRLLGWLLLALALVYGVTGWGQGVGWVTWLGWLTVAGAGLVFAFPYWERARSATPARERRKAAHVPLLPPLRSRPLRAVVLAAVIIAPLAYLAAVALSPEQPVRRADAIAGQAGPWRFTVAEYDRRVPRILLGDFPTKSYQIRFCNACDDQIRAAYLKVNKPRSLRGAGIVFDAERWNRFVEIQLPNSTGPDSEIWLTVEGKDGSLHHASFPIRQISPATADWLQDRRQEP